jgi:hypothetical protein
MTPSATPENYTTLTDVTTPAALRSRSCASKPASWVTVEVRPYPTNIPASSVCLPVKIKTLCQYVNRVAQKSFGSALRWRSVTLTYDPALVAR